MHSNLLKVRICNISPMQSTYHGSIKSVLYNWWNVPGIDGCFICDIYTNKGFDWLIFKINCTLKWMGTHLNLACNQPSGSQHLICLGDFNRPCFCVFCSDWGLNRCYHHAKKSFICYIFLALDCWLGSSLNPLTCSLNGFHIYFPLCPLPGQGQIMNYSTWKITGACFPQNFRQL